MDPEIKPEGEIEVAEGGGAPATSEEESKVPYSRFKKFHERAIAAEQAAAVAEENYQRVLRERGEQSSSSHSDDSGADQPPGWWIENYGDTEATRKAWKNQYKHEQELIERAETRAEERAIARLQENQQYETQRVSENIETIDDNLEDLSALVGRDLTEAEQSGVLDIVDEFTPKDRDGNYLGSILPFDKAWEVYEMRGKTQGAGRREERNRVASLSGDSGSGEPTSAQAEQDKNFVPGKWGSWRDKLKS